MPLHDGPVIVHFHGGFLDGHISRTGDTIYDGYLNTWSARSFYFATRGQRGAIMLGVSPEEWQVMKMRPDSDETIPMNHLYRVTASRLDDGTMILDAEYEPSRRSS